MSIKEKLTKFFSEIPDKVKLVAVSKTKPVEDILEAYNCGQRIFGENKAQDMAAKFPLLPDNIEWHFIGHLQRNKIKYIAPFVSLIHAVDSFKLLSEINKHANSNNRIINCLLQFHIADESTKFGLSINEANELLEQPDFKLLNSVKIVGVMGMATYTDNTDQIREEFKKLAWIFNELKARYFTNNDEFKEISMGMSGDYKIAIEEGSTMIRIGTTIFGDRDYSFKIS